MPCSAPGRCADCKHWEPTNRWDANGYCPVFVKRTTREHGSQCTAYEAQNDKHSEPAEGRATTKTNE